MSLADSEVEGIGLPSNVYLKGVERRRLIIIDFPGQSHARGTDVYSFDVQNFTGLCEDTKGVNSNQNDQARKREAVLRACYLV